MVSKVSLKRFRAKRILTHSGWLENAVIICDEQGYITAIMQDSATDTANQYDTIMPALIDTHIHGIGGSDVMDATHDALNTISIELAKQGIGAFLATTVTSDNLSIEKTLRQIKHSQQQGVSGALLLGSYLEGPFFHADYKGAHPENRLCAPSMKLLEKWVALADGSLKCVALAPEYESAPAIIAWLKKQGIRVMLGHTSANVDTIKTALSSGADGIVHCFNGMTGLHHRSPGAVGAALTCPNCDVEIIVDGHHVHPVAVNIAYRCCQQNLILISDAMRATSMPDGQYQLGELVIRCENGIATTSSGGLAGSTLTLNKAVKNFAEFNQIPFEQAWLHGSLYPARALSIEHQLGSLAPGKWANFVVLSQDNTVLATIVKGNIVYQSPEILPESLCISFQPKIC